MLKIPVVAQMATLQPRLALTWGHTLRMRPGTEDGCVFGAGRLGGRPSPVTHAKLGARTCTLLTYCEQMISTINIANSIEEGVHMHIGGTKEESYDC